MTNSLDAAYRVQICCTLCGNRAMRDVTTGQADQSVTVFRSVGDALDWLTSQ